MLVECAKKISKENARKQVIGEATKIQYEPDQMKRWHVSKDSTSRSRIAELKLAHDSIKDEFKYSKTSSIPVAFSVYGSLTKGKVLSEQTARYADIDFDVFYDEDELTSHFLEVIAFNPNSEFSQLFLKIMEGEYPAGLLNTDETARLRKKIALTDLERGALVNVPIKAARKALSYIVSMKLLRFCPDYAGYIKSYKDLETIWFPAQPKPISKFKRTILTSVEKQLKEYPARTFIDTSPYYWGYSFAIASFFHLDVGGSMKSYIQDFLIDLRDNYSPEVQEQYWQIVATSVQIQERGTEQIPDTLQHQFPSNFTSALSYYGIQRKKKTYNIVKK